MHGSYECALVKLYYVLHYFIYSFISWQENSKRFDRGVTVRCRLVHHSCSCHDIFIWNGRNLILSPHSVDFINKNLIHTFGNPSIVDACILVLQEIFGVKNSHSIFSHMLQFLVCLCVFFVVTGHCFELLLTGFLFLLIVISLQELHNYLSISTTTSIIVDRSSDEDYLRIDFNIRYAIER